MFGKNPVRKQDLREDGHLWVQEVFATIQGEGAHAGTPSIFIRLAGCNLTCDFCDTEFESAFETPYNQHPAEGIMELVWDAQKNAGGCTNVVITGGEPFRQNIAPLVRLLLQSEITVEIETAGTLWIPGFDGLAQLCHITVSPKTPRINKSIEKFAKAFKFVVDETNITRSPKGQLIVSGYPVPVNKQPVYIQPMDQRNGVLKRRNIEFAVELCMLTGLQLSVQTHKYIGVE